MRSSIMLRPSPLLDLFPCTARIRMSQESSLSSSQFFQLGFGDGRFLTLLRNAIPQVFHQLESLRSSEFEQRCKFGVHADNGHRYDDSIQPGNRWAAGQSLTTFPTPICP